MKKYIIVSLFALALVLPISKSVDGPYGNHCMSIRPICAMGIL